MRNVRSLLLIMVMLTFPIWVTPYSYSFGAAVAGHAVPGGYYCGCGEPNCVTSPGECDFGRTANSNDVSGIVAIILVMLFLGYRIK